MKNLTANEIACVNGGLSPSAYIAFCGFRGAAAAAIPGLMGQIFIMMKIAAAQEPPYTIGRTVSTTILSIIKTSPILGATMVVGATAGVVIGAINLGTGMATNID